MSAIYGMAPKTASAQITDFLQPPMIGVRSNDVNRTPFHRALSEAMNANAAVRFSEPAQERMKSMGIEAGADVLARLEKALKQAQHTGAKQAVAMVERHAYVLDVERGEVVDVLHSGPNAERPKEEMNYRIQHWAVITQP